METEINFRCHHLSHLFYRPHAIFPKGMRVLLLQTFCLFRGGNDVWIVLYFVSLFIHVT